MHIETTAGELLKALKTVAPALAKGRKSIPILGCVLIEGATMTACNLSMQIKTSFAATRARGRVAVVARHLEFMLNALDASQPIKLSRAVNTKDDTLHLEFQNGHYDLMSMPADDYPPLAAPVGEMTEAPDDFLAALRAVSGFASQEETRYYLNGVCVSNDKDGQPCLVATDGHRLAAHRIDLDVEGNPIIPSEAVRALLQLPAVTSCAFMQPNGEKGVAPVWARFLFPGGELITKTIDGVYPAWTRVVPDVEARPVELAVDRKEALRAIRRLAWGGSGSRFPRSPAIMLTVEDGVFVVCRKDDMESLSGSERLENASAQSVPAEFLICFNARYLRHVLEAHQGETIRVVTDGDGAPCVIAGDDEALSTVLMPMRAGNEDFARGCVSLFRPARAAA